MRNTLDIPDRLKKILHDNKSGSNTLLQKLNLYFIENLNNFTELKELFPSMKKHFRSFRGITAYLEDLEKIKTLEEAGRFLYQKREKEEGTYRTIFNKLFPLIRNNKRIVTLSNSRTVLEFISLLDPKNGIVITISESRPRNEGKIMAKNLAKKGFKIEFITEAMLASFIGKCDSVILGADQILSNGSIVNKTGSRNAAILCKEFKKPLYVIADRKKKTKSDKYAPCFEQSGEIWKVNNPDIKVINYYFEVVEKEYISKIITD